MLFSQYFFLLRYPIRASTGWHCGYTYSMPPKLFSPSSFMLHGLGCIASVSCTSGRTEKWINSVPVLYHCSVPAHLCKNIKQGGIVLPVADEGINSFQPVASRNKLRYAHTYLYASCLLPSLCHPKNPTKWPRMHCAYVCSMPFKDSITPSEWAKIPIPPPKPPNLPLDNHLTPSIYLKDDL